MITGFANLMAILEQIFKTLFFLLILTHTHTHSEYESEHHSNEHYLGLFSTAA